MKHSGYKELAKVLRHDLTDAETRLWFKLRELQLDGIKFRRQHPLGNFIVDFVCISHKLIIEVDGGQHNDAEHRLYDEERSNWLVKQGYRVLRFWGNDVLLSMDSVMSRIMEEIVNIHPHPNPLPQRARELFRKA